MLNSVFEDNQMNKTKIKQINRIKFALSLYDSKNKGKHNKIFQK